MKRVIGDLILFCVVCSGAFATPITLFVDTDLFLKRAKDIVVAECISESPQETLPVDDLQVIDVNIVKVLKGDGKPGHFRIATIYPMKPQTTYMLYSLGGSSVGTNFLALPELSVVPLPVTFNVEELKDKELKEQVQCIFSRRLYELERELAPLLQEKELLEKAVSDRRYEWYESDGPMRIGRIVEASTQTEDKSSRIRLDLDGKKLMWSQCSSGKNGFFYFNKVDTAWTPYWEFSPCEVANIEALAGKPIKAQFYGLHTPGRGESALGWNGLCSIWVKVGQVLLARTVDDPRKIFVIQIERQALDQEQMSVRYAIIRR